MRGGSPDDIKQGRFPMGVELLLRYWPALMGGITFVLALLSSWSPPVDEGLCGSNGGSSSLSRDMLERGMSAEEIARVISASGTTPADQASCSRLQPAPGRGPFRRRMEEERLVLAVAEDRYLVHYVGTGMDENEWVEQACRSASRPTRPSSSTRRPDTSRRTPRLVKGPMMAEI